MANVLINGMKSKVGGGKVIFDSYLRLLKESDPVDHYYVLTPDRDAYRHYNSDKITIIDAPRWAHSNLSTIPLYRHVFPNLLKRYAIDAILNFGDIIIPTDLHQIYNFDWPHAVYPEHVKSMSMGLPERILYAVKLRFFEAYLSRATKIMAQTSVMKERLEARYGLDNVVLVPPAVRSAPIDGEPVAAFSLPAGRRFLAYPSNYYPHKNIEVLVDVAAILKARGSDIAIITTLNADEHEAAAAFLDRVRELQLSNFLINVGRLPSSQIPALFRASDGLLMPTLMETFGLPYVEAMQHRRPIFTSDRDFARAVCGDSAIYFDPHSADDIITAIDRVFSDYSYHANLIENGRKRLDEMWDWPMVFAEYQRLLGVG